MTGVSGADAAVRARSPVVPANPDLIDTREVVFPPSISIPRRVRRLHRVLHGARRSARRPRADPKNEPRESAVGRATHSWGVAHTRHRRRRDQCEQVHAPPETTRADVADVPEESPTTTVSVDFFTVPTIRFQVLSVFLVLAHDRRRILHVGVTDHPTAAWTAQQLREACLWDMAPRYLLRDRDGIFGRDFVDQVAGLGMSEVLSTSGSSWQRAYIERVIGTIRRECFGSHARLH